MVNVECQATPDDYVRRFMSALENPAMRLVTENGMTDWTIWGHAGKAAILEALKRDEMSQRARVAAMIELLPQPSASAPQASGQ